MNNIPPTVFDIESIEDRYVKQIYRRLLFIFPDLVSTNLELFTTQIQTSTYQKETVFTRPLDFLMSSQTAKFEQDKKNYA